MKNVKISSDWVVSTSGIDADSAEAELSEIHQRDGILKPAAVVEAARPATSALHPAFEWRNHVAAQKYREHQARHLIKSVRVVKDSGAEYPAYVAVKVISTEGKVERGYQRTEIAIERPDEWLSALREFTTRIASARNSLDELQAIAGSHQDKDRLAALAMAAQALSVAASALQIQH